MTQQAIDLDFRPAGYFRPQPLEDFRLAQVKNSQFRAHLRGLLASERHDEAARILREEGVSDQDCRALQRIHPLHMGGNYLPNPRAGKVEITRIQIYSTTGNVAAIYARRVGPRIRHRIVDEYAGETLEGKATRDPVKPLTLGALHDFLTGAWGVARGSGSGRRQRRRKHVRVLRGCGGIELLPQVDALCRQRVLEAFPEREEEDSEEADTDNEADRRAVNALRVQWGAALRRAQHGLLRLHVALRVGLGKSPWRGPPASSWIVS